MYLFTTRSEAPKLLNAIVDKEIEQCKGKQTQTQQQSGLIHSLTHYLTLLNTD